MSHRPIVHNLFTFACYISIEGTAICKLWLKGYGMDHKSNWDRKIITIPNILSLFRLLLIPVMIYCYLELGKPAWTIVVLGISGLTDIADGKIARTFHMTSDLGKMLDPMADKLTQLALLVCLFAQHGQLVYVFVMQAVKDLLLGAVGLVVIKRTRQVNSSVWHGKLCTVVLYCSLLILFVFPEISDTAVWVITVCCITAIWCSFALYMLRYRSLLRQQKQES